MSADLRQVHASPDNRDPGIAYRQPGHARMSALCQCRTGPSNALDRMIHSNRSSKPRPTAHCVIMTVGNKPQWWYTRRVNSYRALCPSEMAGRAGGPAQRKGVEKVVIIDFETTGHSPDPGGRATGVAAVRLMTEVAVLLCDLSLAVHNTSFKPWFGNPEMARTGCRALKAFACLILPLVASYSTAESKLCRSCRASRVTDHRTLPSWSAESIITSPSMALARITDLNPRNSWMNYS